MRKLAKPSRKVVPFGKNAFYISGTPLRFTYGSSASFEELPTPTRFRLRPSFYRRTAWTTQTMMVAGSGPHPSVDAQTPRGPGIDLLRRPESSRNCEGHVTTRPPISFNGAIGLWSPISILGLRSLISPSVPTSSSTRESTCWTWMAVSKSMICNRNASVNTRIFGLDITVSDIVVVNEGKPVDQVFRKLDESAMMFSRLCLRRQYGSPQRKQNTVAQVCR